MHIPTPLTFEQLANGKVLIEHETRDDIKVIAEMVETDLPGRQYADDIIRAVNAHEAMKAALKLAAMRIGCGCTTLPCAMCRHAEEAIHKAIILAEGKG